MVIETVTVVSLLFRRMGLIGKDTYLVLGTDEANIKATFLWPLACNFQSYDLEAIQNLAL